MTTSRNKANKGKASRSKASPVEKRSAQQATYFSEFQNSYFTLKELEDDYDKALYYFKASYAKQCDKEEQQALAFSNEAIKFFTRAADNGDNRAYGMLYRIYKGTDSAK